MEDYLTAQRLQELKQKIIALQSSRSSGYGSDLITHRITNESDPEEIRGGIVDATARDIKNALLDFNDFDNNNAIHNGSFTVEGLDNLEAEVDKLTNATEPTHGCRGACAGLCTGTCMQKCAGCTGDATVVGCGSGNCAGGCRSSCSGLRKET